MKKSLLNITIVSSWVYVSSHCDLEQNKKAALFNRVAFYVHREHSAFNFHSDYIENKTTKGGCINMQSMLNISFTTYKNLNACNANPATCDLNLNSSNQPQTKYRLGTVFTP